MQSNYLTTPTRSNTELGRLSHTLKHEFLVGNWHIMNRMPNKIRPALCVAPYWRLHTLKNMPFLVTLLTVLFSLSKHFRIKTPVRYNSSYSRGSEWVSRVQRPTRHNIGHFGGGTPGATYHTKEPTKRCVSGMENPIFFSDPYAKLCTNR